MPTTEEYNAATRTPLFGAPCQGCWSPADSLIIFPTYRIVVHEDPMLKPCLTANPKEVKREPALSPWWKAPTVKRKVGRPPTSGKYISRRS